MVLYSHHLGNLTLLPSMLVTSGTSMRALEVWGGVLSQLADYLLSWSETR